jgi:hypothetical protein
MGSLRHEIIVEVNVDRAWEALREVGLAHRLFAGVLVAGEYDGEVRTVTFANGLVTRERIVDVSDERRRIAYSAFEGTPMSHHNASMQIDSDQEGRCRFVWIADFLPDAFGETMLPLMRQGAEALKANLESGAFWDAAGAGLTEAASAS